MKEILVSAETLPEAYHQALLELWKNGEYTPCPDYNTNQKECSMTMVVEEPLGEPLISRLFIGGFKELEQYRLEMLDGILDFEIERGNWAYTYHSRMAEQIPFILRDLTRNPSSRRAVIDIRDWRHDAAEGNENPACLQHIQYFIRDGKLHCKVLFRSNDACKATFMNAFALILLQKRIADTLGVEMGSYTHRANSYHCYARDFDLLEGYVRRIRERPDDCTYDYEGEFEELIAMAAPGIAEAVEKLKNRE
jgi:thymidylate synthase